MQLYCSQVWNKALKQAGVEASSDLWKVENVYYPPAIRETAPSSFETGGVPEEAEAAGTVVAVTTTTPDEPAKESKPPRVAKTGEGLSLKAPPRAAESMAEAQAPYVKEPALLIKPLQAVSLGKGSKDLEITSA